MRYAPVMIPTLNRYDKFVKCIESLSNNTGAENTEVYISLDFPPEEKYVEGYNNIKSYLSDIDRLGFKKVHVFIQTINLGPRANAKFLKDKIRERWDVYISTEDDNIFSPCFLDYINKGLDIFENDENVVMICGYRNDLHADDAPNNVAEIYNFSPWGFGTWFKKNSMLCEQISRGNFRKILKQRDLCCKLYKYRPDLFRYFFEAAMTEPADRKGIYGGYLDRDGNVAYIDHTYSPIMVLKDCYGVAPSLSLVRNTGVEDQSGVHTCTWTDFDYSKQKISEEKEFTYVIKRKLCSYVESKRVNNCFNHAASRAWILRYIYLLFGVKVTRFIMKMSYRISRNLFRSI